jgi:phospholipid-binding lipoprotein MlaA
MKIRKTKPAKWVCLAAVAALSIVGCKPGPDPRDPWESLNRQTYKFNDGLDHVLLKPVADGYVKVIPKPVRTCIGNAFDNLVYLDVVLNDYLQKKPDQGWSDLWRFATNSTVGVLGLFDPATKWGMPVHENDFGLTLRRWGVKPGPYIMIPLLGPSTVADSMDYPVTYVVTPTSWFNISWKITVPLYVVDTVDLRSRADRLVRFRNEAAIDPYIFTREAYLDYRAQKAGGAAAPTTSSIYDEDIEKPAPTTAPTSAPQ